MSTARDPQRLTLPWAQQVWDAPVPEDRRETLMQAFAPPELDQGDRTPLIPQDVVSLAVVLDLLATRLRPLAESPKILAQAAKACVDAGLLGGAARDAVCERLEASALSATAHGRAAFVSAFGHAMEDVHGSAEHTTTQHAVMRALGRITCATTLVIREAELLLSAKRARSAWQI